MADWDEDREDVHLPWGCDGLRSQTSVNALFDLNGLFRPLSNRVRGRRRTATDAFYKVQRATALDDLILGLDTAKRTRREHQRAMGMDRSRQPANQQATPPR